MSTEVISVELCLCPPARWALICLFVAVSCDSCAQRSRPIDRQRLQTTRLRSAFLFSSSPNRSQSFCISVQGPGRLQLILLVASLVCIPFSSPGLCLTLLSTVILRTCLLYAFWRIARAVAEDCCVFSRLLQEHVSFFSSRA